MVTTPPSVLALLRLASVLGVGGAGCAFALFTVRAYLVVARRKLAAYHDALVRECSFLRLAIAPRHLLFGQAALVALALLALALGNPLAASVVVLPALCLQPVLGMRRARRIAELESQLDAWLRGLAAALRATPALGDALEYSLGLVASPLRDELETLVKEHKLGTPLDEGLTRMGRRIGSRSLQTALATLRIGLRTGEISRGSLERSASTLREMARLEGVVRVKTAEGKAQGFVLALLPLPMVALFRYVNPTYLLPLIEEPRGHLVMGCAFLCWFSSLVLTRRILDVDL
ncbi:MAG: type II secretion system F family protein [Myxococcales bacterium]